MTGDFTIHSYLSGQVPRELGHYYKNIHENIYANIEHLKPTVDGKEVFWRHYNLGGYQNMRFNCATSIVISEEHQKKVLGICVCHMYSGSKDGRKFSIIGVSYLFVDKKVERFSSVLRTRELLSSTERILQTLAADRESFVEGSMGELAIHEEFKRRDLQYADVQTSKDGDLRLAHLYLNNKCKILYPNYLSIEKCTSSDSNYEIPSFWLTSSLNLGLSAYSIKFYIRREAYYTLSKEKYEYYRARHLPKIYKQVDAYAGTLREFYNDPKLNPYTIHMNMETGYKIVRKDVEKELAMVEKMSDRMGLHKRTARALRNVSRCYPRRAIFPHSEGFGFPQSSIILPAEKKLILETAEMEA